jgi:hypothetical protein
MLAHCPRSQGKLGHLQLWLAIMATTATYPYFPKLFGCHNNTICWHTVQGAKVSISTVSVLVIRAATATVTLLSLASLV